ncbi:extracellular solute-binding protein [Streptomyces violaceusniger]|uniref:Extracellular solute-binding protein family 1 n=1 Tax=Streptomyces violaceusniger (strain Tu 4113) TaxID=653045 RepID=G2P2G8_STRV4|nr:extracellular solute-binding protein [Streptomyces violaceusniger]AEM81940.1 extracellular solute-binding protein family 1 [Streptomyces violaceusniger Tu 4113]
MLRRTAYSLLVLALAGAATACGRSPVDPETAAKARGPITIWLSNNAQEVAWGKSMVEAWNKSHPGQHVTAQQIPAGKTSEEAISASIIAGTSACLVFNTAPASVPTFEKQNGLVSLSDFPDGDAYIHKRGGALTEQYRSQDGEFYQLPWKSNPVMILYNKKIFKKAGLDPEHPRLATYGQFLETSRTLVRSGAAKAAIWPAPSSEFFQSWLDFYPAFAAESGGKRLIEDGEAQFDSTAGRRAAAFWRTLYAEKLAPQELYPGDAVNDGKAAMATVGPWAVSAYKDSVDIGVAPVPTAAGKSPKDTYSFSDEKSAAMFSACRNRATAWDLLKFATSAKQDGSFLDATGQMPMREDLTARYPALFAKKPLYKAFAGQAEHVVEVPNVPGSIDIWQAFRAEWTKSVVFGDGSTDAALRRASDKITKLLDEYGDPS